MASDAVSEQQLSKVWGEEEGGGGGGKGLRGMFYGSCEHLYFQFNTSTTIINHKRSN